MKLGTALKGLSGKVNAGYSKWKSEEPKRNAARLANLKSKAAREKEMSAIKKERLEARREVTQAQTALQRARTEYKASKGGSFNLDKILGIKKKTVKHAARRRTAVKARVIRRIRKGR